MRFVRPAMPLRVMVARPAMMARGYPARSEMSDDEAEVAETSQVRTDV